MMIKQYLHVIYAALSVLVLIIMLVICWNVQGWRMGAKVAEAQAEVARLNGVIGAINERVASLGRERELASAVAAKAQQDASALRVSVNEKTKQIMALKASTCAAVTESQWGKP